MSKLGKFYYALFAVALPGSWALATCKDLLTVRTLYQSAQEKMNAGNALDAIDWNVVAADLKRDGAMSEHEIALVAASEYLRPALKSGLLEDAVRIALLSVGIRPKELKNTLEYLRNHALPTDQVERIVERVILVLNRENLPKPALENMGTVSAIQKRYRLTPAAYQVLAAAIHSDDSEVQMKLRIAVLAAITQSDTLWTDRIASPWFWVMWRHQRLAARLSAETLDSEKNNQSTRVATPFSVAFKSLKSIYGDPLEMTQERLIANLNAVRKLVVESAELSTGDLLDILEYIPMEARLVIKNYQFSKSWLQKKHIQYCAINLEILGAALKRIHVRDVQDMGLFGKSVLAALESTYDWQRLPRDFQLDVYRYVDQELHRITILPLGKAPATKGTQHVSRITKSIGRK